jgi:3-methyladenine DNA glycosylase Tag
MNEIKRCEWCGSDPLYMKYHDEEWGRPVFDDKTLFEFLILEGFQAGLSWITILRKRENFRKAFDNFDYTKIANYSDQISKDLKKRGFKFVGSTIVYAHMQATGMVNDHITDCVVKNPAEII